MIVNWLNIYQIIKKEINEIKFLKVGLIKKLFPIKIFNIIMGENA